VGDRPNNSIGNNNMEIVFDALGNAWKLKNPTGKFELFESFKSRSWGYSGECWHHQYRHVGTFESHEDLIKNMTQKLDEDDRLYIFFPNGRTHDDPRSLNEILY
jgi:uncharacterized FAD-dependent dehydrogenase